MFDLEKQISEWRKQMLGAGIKIPAPLEELESHLREEIEHLVKSGHEEETAFNTAVHKIGSGQALQHEFMKAETPGKNLKWRLVEIYFLLATLVLPLLAGWLVYFSKADRVSDMNSSQQTSSLAAVIVFSLVAWGMRLSSGRFPGLQTDRIRNVIFVPVLLWLTALAYVIMPNSQLTESQSAVVSLWGITPFGILAGWCWGYATARRQTSAQIRS